MNLDFWNFTLFFESTGVTADAATSDRFGANLDLEKNSTSKRPDNFLQESLGQFVFTLHPAIFYNFCNIKWCL